MYIKLPKIASLKLILLSELYAYVAKMCKCEIYGKYNIKMRAKSVSSGKLFQGTFSFECSSRKETSSIRIAGLISMVNTLISRVRSSFVSEIASRPLRKYSIFT